MIGDIGIRGPPDLKWIRPVLITAVGAHSHVSEFMHILAVCDSSAIRTLIFCNIDCSYYPRRFVVVD